MANFIGKAIDAIFSRGESKEIIAMKKRAKERDNNEPVKKTAAQLKRERNIAESMKINNEESRA